MSVGSGMNKSCQTMSGMFLHNAHFRLLSTWQFSAAHTVQTLFRDPFYHLLLHSSFRISPPARITDLSMRPRNDLDCGTWDDE